MKFFRIGAIFLLLLNNTLIPLTSVTSEDSSLPETESASLVVEAPAEEQSQGLEDTTLPTDSELEQPAEPEVIAPESDEEEIVETDSDLVVYETDDATSDSDGSSEDSQEDEVEPSEEVVVPTKTSSFTLRNAESSIVEDGISDTEEESPTTEPTNEGIEQGFSAQLLGGDPVATCDEPTLSLSEIYVHDFVTVTCNGENIGMRQLQVKQGNNLIMTTGKKTGNTFNYAPAFAGTFTFECRGRAAAGATGDPICSTTAVVEDTIDVPVCYEPTVGGDFAAGQPLQITCNGDNLASHQLVVTTPSGSTTALPKSTNPTFSYTPATNGEYSFTCLGRPKAGIQGETSCTTPVVIEQEQKAICYEPILKAKELAKGETFQVTCQGENIMKHQVRVTTPSGQIITLPQSQNPAFSYQATSTGNYTFTCLGRPQPGYEGETSCSTTGTVKEPKEAICREPVLAKKEIKKGELFQVTCQGDNIAQHMLTVYKVGTTAAVYQSAKQTSASFSYQPTGVGEYTFVCNGRPKPGYTKETECRTTGKVYDDPAICTEEVTPQYVYKGGQFTVTCRGANIDTYHLTVKKNAQTVYTQNKQDANDDDREDFTFAGSEVGTYTFICEGTPEGGSSGTTCQDGGNSRRDSLLETGSRILRGGNSAPTSGSCTPTPTPAKILCGTVDREVKPVCEDPVTSIAVTSHTALQQVSTNVVTIGGTFAGDVDTVEVRVNNGGVIQGTVNKATKTRTAVIGLSEGTNTIVINGLSTDPLCGSKQTTLKLVYVPEDVCRAPIDIKITSHSQLSDNNQLNNIIETSSSPVTVGGTYTGSLQSIMVVVDHANGTSSTYNAIINSTAKTWSVAIPVQQGTSNIRIKGISSQHEECNYITDFIIKYIPEEQLSCESPIVTPDVSVEVGEDFSITCRGTNVGGFKMTVKKGNQTVNEQTATDTNDDDREVFTRKGLSEGQYTIHCDASTESNPTTYVKYCGAKTRVVTEKPYCVDPVTSIAITSHTNEQQLTGNTVTIGGTFAGDVDTVEVRVNNGGIIQGTVNKATKTRSATITLIEGINRISVKGLSTDPLCGSKQTTIKLHYQEEDICRDPITVRVTNIPQLADNDQTNNIVNTSSSPVVVQGTYSGSVQSIMVVVDSASGTSTTYNASLNPASKTRSVTLPVSVGTSNVWIKGISYQHEDCNYLDDFIIKYIPEEKLSCVSPIVTPDVSVFVGEDFSITCLGENAGGFKMTVKKGEQIVDVQSRADTNDDDREVFPWKGTADGQYTIHCDASTESNPTTYIKYCGAKTRIVNEKEPICEDPVNSITVTSHTNQQQVTSGSVLISGVFSGDVDTVEVRVNNGGVIQGTVNKANNTRSATVSLIDGINRINVKGISNDPLCGSKQTSLKLYYQPEPVCVDPITVRVTNIPQLADNDQTNNIVNTSSSPVVVQGTYSGSVQSIMVVVDSASGSSTYTASLNPASKTWLVTLPVSVGTSNVRIKGVSYQHEDCNYLDDFIIKYIPEEKLSCVSPIVTPDVSVFVGEDFSITCLGENAGGFKMTVKKGNQTVNEQTATDTNDDDREVFTRKGLSEGQYTIHCDASTESNPTTYVKYCGAKTRIVKERDPVCEDPITSVTLTSHTYGQVVNTGSVVISGTVTGGVGRVDVQIGATTVNASINGSVRTATIQVVGSGTAFTVRGTPADAECETKSVNGLLNVADQPKKSDPAIEVSCTYGSGMSCGDTMRCTAYIANTIGAQAPAQNLQAYLDVLDGNSIVSTGIVVQVLQSDSLTCQTTSSDQIACSGSLAVGSQATVSFDVQVASCPCEGSNRFVYEGRVQASNGDLNTANNFDSRTQRIYSDQTCGGNICETPLTLVVDTPVNNMDTNSSSVEVVGRVSGTGAVVRVNNSTVSVTSGGEFRTTVSLGIGNNTITVGASNDDPACNQQIVRVVDRDGGGGHGGNGRKSTITCGNGRIEERRDEECDDGNTRNGDGCSSTCEIEDDEDPECGNDIVELNEQCDDGNNRNGDGCDSSCDLEDEAIKEKVRKVKIEEVLTERKRPEPLGYMPPVLPKTGVISRETSSLRVVLANK